MRSFGVAALLAGYAIANPLPQGIDWDLVEALPAVPTASIPVVDAEAAQTSTPLEPAQAAAAIEAAVLANPEDQILKRGAASLCPADSKTPQQWQKGIKSTAGASTPAGYERVFANLGAASQSGFGYMGFSVIEGDSYNTQECATRCNTLKGCQSFNLYYERAPSVDPSSSCRNPASKTVLKCVYFGAPLKSAAATNAGQRIQDFRVLIAGSNGYTNRAISTPKGYQTRGSLRQAILNVPAKDCAGNPTYLGVKTFQDGPFSADKCAAACTATSESNRGNPNVWLNGKPRLCQSFVTYILYNGSTATGQFCAMYDKTWSTGFATEKGQWRDKDFFSMDFSYMFSNITAGADKVTGCENSPAPGKPGVCRNTNQFWSTSENACVSYATCNIRLDEYLDKTTNTCKTCDADKEYLDMKAQKCVAYPTCDIETQYLDKTARACKSYPTCEADTQYLDKDKKECVSYPECTPEEYLDKTKKVCVAFPTCDSGSQYLDKDKAECVSYPTCTSDQYLDKSSKSCVAYPTCNDKQVLNKETKACEEPASDPSKCGIKANPGPKFEKAMREYDQSSASKTFAGCKASCETRTPRFGVGPCRIFALGDASNNGDCILFYQKDGYDFIPKVEDLDPVTGPYYGMIAYDPSCPAPKGSDAPTQPPASDQTCGLKSFFSASISDNAYKDYDTTASTLDLAGCKASCASTGPRSEDGTGPCLFFALFDGYCVRIYQKAGNDHIPKIADLDPGTDSNYGVLAYDKDCPAPTGSDTPKQPETPKEPETPNTPPSSCTQKNFVANGDFENGSGTDITSWTRVQQRNSYYVGEISSESPDSGSKHFSASFRGNLGQLNTQLMQRIQGLEAGKTYKFKARYALGSSRILNGATCMIVPIFRTWTIQYYRIEQNLADKPAGTWQTMENSVTIPADYQLLPDGEFLEFSMGCGTTSGMAVDILLDNVQLVDASCAGDLVPQQPICRTNTQYLDQDKNICVNYPTCDASEYEVLSKDKKSCELSKDAPCGIMVDNSRGTNIYTVNDGEGGSIPYQLLCKTELLGEPIETKTEVGFKECVDACSKMYWTFFGTPKCAAVSYDSASKTCVLRNAGAVRNPGSFIGDGVRLANEG